MFFCLKLVPLYILLTINGTETLFINPGIVINIDVMTSSNATNVIIFAVDI